MPCKLRVLNMQIAWNYRFILNSIDSMFIVKVNGFDPGLLSLDKALKNDWFRSKPYTRTVNKSLCILVFS
jgi:hypothetical protein